MSVVVQRAALTPKDKEYIKEQLTVTSNTDPPTVIKPFLVEKDLASEDPNNGTVRLPFAFYRELRDYGSHQDWPEFPNDAKHPSRFNPEWMFTGQLRDYQQEAWKNELLPMLKARRSGLLGAHTGWGKTATASFIASRTQLITLILYHISPLGRSWPETFSQFTNAIVCHVGKETFNPTAHIYISTVGMALSDKFPLDPAKVGLLVIDEAHAFMSPQRVFSYLRFEPKYVLNLTATPERADGMGKMLGLFHGRLKYGEDNQPLPGQVPCEVIRISKRSFTVYKQRTGLKPKITTNARGLDWAEVKKSMLTRPALVTLICDWVLLNPHKKILIHVVQIDQLEAIVAELKARGEQSVESFFGDMATYNECRVLVAIDKKCGLGFDDQLTCANYGGRRLDMLIMGWTIKNKGVTEQLVGRMRGENGCVIDLCHDFSSFVKHWKQREEWYLSRNGKIVEVNGPIRLPGEDVPVATVSATSSTLPVRPKITIKF
jgi:hypothetical protein